ncbi:MAG TPA: hypothetical protein VGR73_03555 [Bryobacteraceae bacterium]|nr:hypothetical protein [Bryobacteraceae bacterium]
MKIVKSILSSAVLLSAAFVPLCAQWIHYPTPGMPRTPDGKPNLSAPAPKTSWGAPDVSGIWVSANVKYLNDLAADGINVPLQPWAQALYKQRVANNGKGRPSERCLTRGVVDFDTIPMNIKFIQTPGTIAVLYEEYNHFRQIFLDGRPLPKPTQPAYLGYSIGRFDGDTLVVDTTGFNDIGWLDNNGMPQTESLHVTERFHRRDFGHMDLQITIDDMKAYTKPWTVTVGGFNLLADEELIENICENEKDFSHMVGK